MMIQVYTQNQALIERLKTLIGELEVKETLETINKDALVIADPVSGLSLLNEGIEVKVMVLSDMPNFTEGSLLLQKGLKGYANTYIHLLHLNQAIEMINSGNIWLYPSFMQELIARSVKKSSTKEAILNQLTQREQETALLVAEGKSNKEIAISLQITERTVKAHLSSIFSKTGLSDRLSLARSVYS